jgi:hypothetical protein
MDSISNENRNGTGLNDNLADGSQPFTITLTNISSGSDYSEVNPPPVTGTNGDDDTAGLTVSPLSGLLTTEGKTSAKIQVKLNTQPLRRYPELQCSTVRKGEPARSSAGD